MIKLANIQQFIQKVKTAKNINSKELRLTISDAEQLAFELAELLSHELILTNKVSELQNEITLGIEVLNDGGKF